MKFNFLIIPICIATFLLTLIGNQKVSNNSIQTSIMIEGSYAPVINESISWRNVPFDTLLVWKAIPAEGFSKPYGVRAYWLHFKVYIPQSGTYHLVNDYTMLEKFELFIKTNEGQITSFGNSGMDHPDFETDYPFPVWNLNLESGFYDFYIYEYKRFSTAAQHIQLFYSQSFTKHVQNYQFKNGLIYGLFFILLIQGLITFFLFRSEKYIIYCGYIISLMVIYLISEGSFRLIVPKEWHMTVYFFLYYALIGSFLGLFLMFKALVPVTKHISYFSQLLFILFGTSLLLVSLNHYFFLHHLDFPLGLFKISNLMFSVFPITLFLLALYFYYKYKYRQALWLLLVFALTLLFVLLFSLLPYVGISFSLFMQFKWLILFEGMAVLIVLYKDLHVIAQERNQLELSLKEEQFTSALHYMTGLSEERQRIASKLHDDISLDMILLQKSMEKCIQDHQMPDISILASIREIQEKIRTSSHAIHPTFLEHLSLKEAIEAEIQKIEDFFPDLIVIPEIEDELFIGHKKAEEMIYITFLELMQNTLKYSKASEVKIILTTQLDKIMLTVEDNGVGYEVSTAFQNGSGLQAIRRRASSIRGSFDIILLQPGVRHVFSFPSPNITFLN
jgi:signal transduction histidine kinase